MSIPSRADLVGELHCLTEDRLVVITAQHWMDPQAPAGQPVAWLRLVRNGREWQSIRFGGARAQVELAEAWGQLRLRYAPTALTEDQMWVALGELAGVDRVQCSSASKCAGRLPVAWHFCPECGRDQRRVAQGSWSGVRGRPAILLDLRNASS